MNTYAAIANSELILQGDLVQVARRVKSLVDARDQRTLLVFAHPTGQQIDLDLRGNLEDVLAGITGENPTVEKPQRRAVGRPKLGVVGREVTLLPRHWEWLNAQPGGASVALRKLVEQARRALFAGDQAAFKAQIQSWREGVRDFAHSLAAAGLGSR